MLEYSLASIYCPQFLDCNLQAEWRALLGVYRYYKYTLSVTNTGSFDQVYAAGIYHIERWTREHTYFYQSEERIIAPGETQVNVHDDSSRNWGDLGEIGYTLSGPLSPLSSFMGEANVGMYQWIDRKDYLTCSPTITNVTDAYQSFSYGTSERDQTTVCLAPGETWGDPNHLTGGWFHIAGNALIVFDFYLNGMLWVEALKGDLGQIYDWVVHDVGFHVTPPLPEPPIIVPILPDPLLVNAGEAWAGCWPYITWAFGYRPSGFEYEVNENTGLIDGDWYNVYLTQACTIDYGDYHYELNAGSNSFQWWPNVQRAYLTVRAEPGSGGTVTGSGWYDVGAYAPITATPFSGYSFANWEGSGIDSLTSPSTTAWVGTDRTVTAYFTADVPPIDYTLHFPITLKDQDTGETRPATSSEILFGIDCPNASQSEYPRDKKSDRIWFEDGAIWVKKIRGELLYWNTWYPITADKEYVGNIHWVADTSYMTEYSYYLYSDGHTATIPLTLLIPSVPAPPPDDNGPPLNGDGTFDQFLQWIKDNPVLAAGIGIGALLLGRKR